MNRPLAAVAPLSPGERGGDVYEKKRGQGDKPPRAKPRSIFLTPSMEALETAGLGIGGETGDPRQGTAV